MKTYLQSQPPQALLFDIDNTLYRDERYVQIQIESQIGGFAEERGISLPEANTIIDRTKNEIQSSGGRRPSLANTLVALGIPIANSVAWRRERIVPEEYLAPDEQTVATIETLHRILPIAALTNNPVEIGERSLHALGIDRFFVSVTGLDSTWESKPSWGPFRHALKSLGITAEEVLIVGDRYDVDLDPILRAGGSGILVESAGDLHLIPEILGEKYGLSERA